MINGKKTMGYVSLLSGMVLAAVLSPEFQEFIKEHALIAFVVNNFIVAMLRWHTTKPLPMREKLLEKQGKPLPWQNPPPHQQKKGY